MAFGGDAGGFVSKISKLRSTPQPFPVSFLCSSGKKSGPNLRGPARPSARKPYSNFPQPQSLNPKPALVQVRVKLKAGAQGAGHAPVAAGFKGFWQWNSGANACWG